jgi:hypothetical protein
MRSGRTARRRALDGAPARAAFQIPTREPTAMSVCFYKCADELESRAEELETAGSGLSERRITSARTLRDLARQIRSDSRPCVNYPGCGCGS